MTKKTLFLLCYMAGILSIGAQTNTKYLFVVTTDGLRWQEVFNGADSLLLTDKGFTPDPEIFQKQYWAPTPEARREKLMPFLWSAFTREGCLYGNRTYGNYVNVSNSIRLSYPGYNELLTGDTDDARIRSNKKVVNPNTNVLEFLNSKPELHDKVVAFTSWDAFPYILHETKSGMMVNSALENVQTPSLTPVQKTLNALQHVQPKYWDDGVRLDFMTYAIAKAYVTARHPAVTFISFDETDEYAHGGKYGPYLDAAHQVDQRLSDLWNFIQNDPVYRNKTALLVTVDHGRGDKVKKQWCDHGPHIQGSDQIWFGIISPDTEACGEQNNPCQIWQKQLAPTMAALLGYDFKCDHPVAETVNEVISVEKSAFAGENNR
jgi:hypothetical protein